MDMKLKIIAFASSIIVLVGLVVGIVFIGGGSETVAETEQTATPDKTVIVAAGVSGGASTSGTRRQVEDFLLSCGVDPKSCIARQQLVEAETRKTVFIWSIGHGPEGKLLAVFHTPTGILLPEGIRFQVGAATQRRIVFRTCDDTRCEAIIPLADDVLAELKTAGDKAVAAYTTVGGREVTRTLSLKGVETVMASIVAN